MGVGWLVELGSPPCTLTGPALQEHGLGPQARCRYQRPRCPAAMLRTVALPDKVCRGLPASPESGDRLTPHPCPRSLYVCERDISVCGALLSGGRPSPLPGAG